MYEVTQHTIDRILLTMSGQNGRILPTHGTNQITGFVECCLFTNCQKKINGYDGFCLMDHMTQIKRAFSLFPV